VGDEFLDLPQGTLELLILRTLALEPRHGWAITERIHQVSATALRVKQGSLYPALHRMQRQGLLKSYWGASESNRRARYYALTRKGRQKLESEMGQWRRLAQAVGQVLEEG
jgi:transcriptional regulator